MSEIQLARAILNAYADADGLTEEEIGRIRSEFELSDQQAETLANLFEDHFIDRSERRDMEGGRFQWISTERSGWSVLPRLFSPIVVRTLAGSDGLRACRERFRRLLEAGCDPTASTLPHSYGQIGKPRSTAASLCASSKVMKS